MLAARERVVFEAEIGAFSALDGLRRGGKGRSDRLDGARRAIDGALYYRGASGSAGASDLGGRVALQLGEHLLKLHSRCRENGLLLQSSGRAKRASDCE